MSAISNSPQPTRGPAAPRPVKRRLRVVKPLPRQAPKVPFVLLLSGVLLLGIVGLLLFNTSMQQASFAAAQLEAQRDQLEDREQSLLMELEELQEPQAIAEQARLLGMVPVTEPAFLELPSGKIIGEARPAAPADGQRIEPLPPPKPKVLEPDPETIIVIGEPDAADAHTTDEKPERERRQR